MKLYKDYTKEPFSFLVNDTTLPLNNSLRSGKKLFKVTVSKKIKTIDKKIEQNKAQYKLGRQTARVSSLSSRNVSSFFLERAKTFYQRKDC